MVYNNLFNEKKMEACIEGVLGEYGIKPLKIITIGKDTKSIDKAIDLFKEKIIDGDFSLGDWVTVKLLNGKTYTRRVYDSRECGLYIVIKNYKYFLYDAI